MNASINKYQASVNFLEFYPPEYQSKLQKIIYQTPVDQRKKVWEREKIPYKKIEEVFVELTKQRNKHALEKGFESNFELFLNLYKISISDYYHLQNKISKAINYCNENLIDERKNLPTNFHTEFGNHCYICLINKFPLESTKEVTKSIYKFDKEIHLLEKRIKIIKKNTNSHTEIDSGFFKIYIDKNQNFRHQSIDLAHEMFHLKNKDNLQNKYLREKETTLLEIEFYKKYYPKLHKALFGEFLKVFHRVIFEIELYKNPNQNLSKLYASVFNRCYKGTYQNSNKSYILDNLIIYHPFQNLPHFWAQIDIILNMNEKEKINLF